MVAHSRWITAQLARISIQIAFLSPQVHTHIDLGWGMYFKENNLVAHLTYVVRLVSLDNMPQSLSLN